MSIPEIRPPASLSTGLPPSPPPTGSDKFDGYEAVEKLNPDPDEETVALAERLQIFDLRKSDIEKATFRAGFRRRRKGVFEAFGLSPEAVSAATSAASSARSSRQSSAELATAPEPPTETNEAPRRYKGIAQPRRNSRDRKAAIRKRRRSREIMKALHPGGTRNDSPALAAALAAVEKGKARTGMDGVLDTGLSVDQLVSPFEPSESVESEL